MAAVNEGIRPAEAGVLARLVTRTFAPPSCSLNVEDLRELHGRLNRLAGEAADLQVRSLTRLEGQSPEDFDAFIQRLRVSCELVVVVNGANGEAIAGTSVLDQVPVNLDRIVFASAFRFRAQAGQDPLNSFTVTLDFRRPRAFQGLLGILEEHNESNIVINGQDTTWVNGVAAELREFFNARSTKRDWLHTPQSYSIAALFGIPLSLYWVYRIDSWLRPSTFLIPEAIKVAVYVYIVLIIMFIYRVTFNVARHTFPVIEGPERETRGIWLQRTPLGVLVAGLLSDILLEAGKVVLRLIGRG